MNPHAVALPHWLSALILLAAAHTTPWATGRLLGDRLAAPIDVGMTFIDGRRLLGDHKTWRGAAAGMLACAVASWLLGYSVNLGLAFAALALTGDAASSLIKRRLRLSPGREVPGLDQIPEALVPLLCLSGALGIGVSGAWTLTGVFLLLDLVTMPLRHTTSSERGSKRPFEP
jgi:CDP-archaeol synthase